MIDYLVSFQAPVKGEVPAESGLSSLFANVALAAAVILLRPAVEQYFGLAIDKHTPISRNNRQSLKAIFVAGHGLISPAMPHLEVKPAAIATAVTVVKGVPTPTQLCQEQSTIGAILGISVCLMLTLVGTTLVFQHSRQGSVLSGTSPSAASSDNIGSSPPPSDRGSTPPSSDSPSDSSDEPSGSDGHPPPVPIFDIFYNAPTLRLDKGVNTNDKEVSDMDGAPPPPPPLFPTPVEDGDAFKSASIVNWLSLTLVLSIASLVINRLFKRFFKGHGKTQKKVPTPTASERITVDEISGNILSPILSVTPIPPVTPIPSVTAKPVIKPTCPNMLPLVETESLGTSISTLVSTPVYERSRKFTNVIICILLLTCLVLLPYLLQDCLDNYLRKTINLICPAGTRGESLKPSDPVEITDETASIEDDNTVADLDDDDDAITSIDGEDVAAEEDITASIDEEVVALDNDDAASVDGGDVAFGINEEDLAASIDEEVVALDDDDDDDASIDGDVVAGIDGDVAVGIDEEVVASGINKEVAALGTDQETLASATDELMKKTVEQDISFNHVVGAGDTTLIVYENASPLAVDLKDILDASENGMPFIDVFRSLSISNSGDEIPVLRERSFTINPMFKLPTQSEKKCTVNSSQDIRVLPERVPKMIGVEQVQAVSKFVLEKAAPIVDKTSRTPKVDTTSKENVPIVNINKASAPARAETLPVLVNSRTTNTKTTEPLNPKAASFVPPISHLPVRQPPMQSSSTSLHYCYSPPSSPRPGLSASMHAPSPRKGSKISMHPPSEPPMQGLSSSMHAPSEPPKQGLSSSIHAPSKPPRQGLSSSMHAPSSPPTEGASASIHAPSPSPVEEGTSASIHAPCTPPRRTLNLSTSVPTEGGPAPPPEPIPIPVVDLSPNRHLRRVVDPKRECDMIVLVGGDSDSA